jgi:hypothetical protein
MNVEAVMRVDVKSLLNRLGKTDFAYREFADRFSDMELWPIFEALLKDPRMMSLDHGGDHFSAPPPSFAMHEEPEAPQRTLSSLFSQYDVDTARPAVKPEIEAQDVRSLLHKLSELTVRGQL